MQESGYAMRITKMLFEEEPGLLACDPGATARAAGSLATVMGSLLATVIVKKNEATYRAVLKELVKKIDDNARATVAAAERESEGGGNPIQ